MRVFVFFMLFTFLSFGLILFLHVERENAFAEKCASQGGEVVHGYKSPSLCFAPDGRRIKI